MYIASLATWDTQLNGLVELERRCQDLMQEVKLLCERLEVLTGMVVSEKAPKKYQEKVFEEIKEFEEQRAKEALELVQKKHMLIKWEGERERAKMLQRLRGSRAIKLWSDARDSCPLSRADMEEVCLESSRKMQDKEETTSEASWTAVAKGKEKEVERPDATVLWNGVEGVYVNPEGESRHWRQVLAKIARKESENQTTMEQVTRVRRFRVRKQV